MLFTLVFLANSYLPKVKHGQSRQLFSAYCEIYKALNALLNT